MDLSVDLRAEEPTYGDLLLVGGDMVLTADADARGTHPILQSVVQRLKMHLGEWFLNKSLGVPYVQQVFVKRPDPAQNETLLRGVILATPGVLSIESFVGTYLPEQRLYRVRFSAQTEAGPIVYDGPANTPSDQVTQ